MYTLLPGTVINVSGHSLREVNMAAVSVDTFKVVELHTYIDIASQANLYIIFYAPSWGDFHF